MLRKASESRSDHRHGTIIIDEVDDFHSKSKANNYKSRSRSKP